MPEEPEFIIETNEATQEQPDTESVTGTKPKRFPVIAQLALLSVLLLALLSGAYLPSLLDQPQPSLENAAEAQAALGVHTKPTTLPIPDLGSIVLEAKAAYVWDVKTQQALYKKDPDEALPLASITKLMTTLMAYELVAGDVEVSVPARAILQEGDSGLYDGEMFSLKTLADYALVASSNDAAYALATAAGSALVPERGEDAFIDAMNIRAGELGFATLNFKNPTGLDLSLYEPGATGSARDISFLMEYILEHYPELLEPTQHINTRIYNEEGRYHNAENTNEIVTEIPNLLGSKTGYTDLAGGTLTIAYSAGLDRPIIITVLGSSRSGRFRDVLTLVDAVQTALIPTTGETNQE